MSPLCVVIAPEVCNQCLWKSLELQNLQTCDFVCASASDFVRFDFLHRLIEGGKLIITGHGCTG